MKKYKWLLPLFFFAVLISIQYKFWHLETEQFMCCFLVPVGRVLLGSLFMIYFLIEPQQVLIKDLMKMLDEIFELVNPNKK